MEIPWLTRLNTVDLQCSAEKDQMHYLAHDRVSGKIYKISDEALLFWELCAFLSEKGFSPIDLVDVCHRPYDNSLWQMDLIFIRSTWEGFKYNSYK